MISIKHRFTGTTLCEFEVTDIRAALVKAVSQGADLQGADLQGADLQGADLRGAYLRGADLQGADLRGADLRGADLQGADLQGADLRGAYLRGADLQGADLRGAYLRGADLRGADLQGADLRGEKLAICPIFINGTIWDITITESFLTIGCQRHEHDKWKAFDDEEISRMESRAAAFWTQNKSWLLAACKAHRKESLAFRKANPEPKAVPA